MGIVYFSRNITSEEDQIMGWTKRLKKTLILATAATLLLLVTAPLGSWGQERNTSWNDAYSRGMNIYRQMCAACHGQNGEGGAGLPLNLQSYLTISSFDYIVKTIRYGRPGRLMPSFQNMLDEERIKAVAYYVKSWQIEESKQVQEGKVRGSEVNGKELYEGICAQCHGFDGKGQQLPAIGKAVSGFTGHSAPALNNEGFLKSASDGFIKATLIYGRVGTPMTAFLKGKQGFVEITEEEIDDIVAYIRSWEADYLKVSPVGHKE
jgi:cytochrome c oxidase cbb3-type subunit 3